MGHKEDLKQTTEEAAEKINTLNMAIDELARLRKADADYYRGVTERLQTRACKAELALESMKAEKCRYQREVNNLRQKLVKIEGGE